MARLTKDEKQKRKQYRKTCKRYKKELKDLVKHYGPWDNFLPWLFDIQVKHWIDYYTLGYNVMALEIKDTPEFNQSERPTRLEIAQELKRLYDIYHGHIDYNTVEDYNKEYNARKKAFFDYYIEYAKDMRD